MTNPTHIYFNTTTVPQNTMQQRTVNAFGLSAYIDMAMTLKTKEVYRIYNALVTRNDKAKGIKNGYRD